MSTDRELLELAAKAYADPNIIKGIYPDFTRWIGRNEDLGCDVFVNFNPLTDDGDALRLAVKLQLQIEHCDYEVVVTEKEYDSRNPIGAAENNAHDPYAATRRAIVRAAAAIAEQGEKE